MNAGRRVAGRVAYCSMLLTWVVVGCSSDGSATVTPTTPVSTVDESTTASTPPTTVTPTAPVTTVSADELVSAGATRLTIEGGVDWMAIAGGYVFGSSGAVVRLDPSTGEPAGSIAIGGVCLAMDVGFESLWVGSCDSGTVFRVNPVTLEIVATIDLGAGGLREESSLAAGEGGVFAVSGDGTTIARIDPATNSVAARFPAPSGATAVRAGFGSLWVTAWSSDTLYRLDPVSGTVQAAVEVGRGPRFLAVGSGAVWTLDQNGGTVSRVDPATNQLVASIPVDDGAVSGGDIAAGGRFVWARVTRDVVAQIDPDTGKVVATFGPPAGSGSVASSDEVVWISAHDSNTVWRLPLG